MTRRLPVLLLCALAVEAPLLAAGPHTFLANEGQWDPAILFRGRSATASVSLLRTGVSFAQVEPEEEEHEEEEHEDHHAAPNFQVWSMRFVDASPDVRISGAEGRRSVTSFLSGSDPAQWVVHPMAYDRVEYAGLYPNIDAHFRQVGTDLEYDYILHPGGEVDRIRNVYRGRVTMELDGAGNLVVTTLYGRQVQRAPVAWQVINGVKRLVDIRFVVHDTRTFGFAVQGDYDHRYDLVIDPLFELVWASYTRAIGAGDNVNYSFANAMDPQGNVYLTGMVDGTFPIEDTIYVGPGNVFPEIFVAKYSAAGDTMLYSTYLPGNSSEHGTSIAVDALGRAYITGIVDLNITGITNFPSTPNAFQPVHSEGSDAILSVLNPLGTGLEYSSFLGGPGGETGYAVALGPLGIAYITGTASGGAGNFPEVAATNYPEGVTCAFVAKFDITQSGPASLLYAIRFGAGGGFGESASCNAHGIAVDAAGNVYVTGNMLVGFGSSNFPVTPGAFSTTYNIGSDNGCAYLVKLGNTLPVSISYATYLGPGQGTSVAVDPATGEAYVVGSTRTTTFPTTTGTLQPVHGADALGNPNSDAFVLKLNATGTDLLYGTFLGGPSSESATDIVVNSAREAYVAGLGSGDFPTSPGALQPQNASPFSQDLWIAHLDAEAAAYACGGATYFGGSQAEYYGSFYDYYAPSISLLDHGGVNDTLSMNATTHSQDLPTTPGVYEEEKVNGIADQPFFLKLTCALEVTAAPVADFVPQTTPTCTGATVDFDDTSSNNASSWTWTFPGGTPSTSSAQNPQDVSFPPGTYTVTLVACNSLGCDEVEQEIVVPVSPVPLIALGNDTTICAGSALTLFAESDGDGYAWLLDGATLAVTTPEITVAQAGTYTVIVTDTSGCAGMDSLEVAITPLPALAFGHSQGGPCRTDQVQFTATAASGAAIDWVFGDGTTGTGTAPTHAYTIPGLYNVEVTATVGACSNTVMQLIDVSTAAGSAFSAQAVPNVFSPNGDGHNDCFGPVGLEAFATCYTLVIHDRWGMELYRTTSPSACWRGTAHGEPVPDGVYYYLLTLGDAPFHGYVELLR